MSEHKWHDMANLCNWRIIYRLIGWRVINGNEYHTGGRVTCKRCIAKKKKNKPKARRRV